ncbi:hypothetical protein RDWZM_000811 [Blomia tropicalis]|uniref:Transmembrane and coiled-coil domains protein 1 n=1 Tax=Blomia tropicalis TaxID=40697 RepID=A0A9Q0RQT7_BLOTA|nr:hypothetical protein RDWZM_000811 [Blomia tropicalis]
MLRNKSPVPAAAAASNTKSSVNFHVNNCGGATTTTTNANNNIINHDNKGNCELNQDQSVGIITPESVQRKLTHRRGFSHGSYSTMSANANPNILLMNQPLSYINSLGRTANSSLEVQLNESHRQNLVNQLSNTVLMQLNKDFINQREQAMKTDSNDQLLNIDENGTGTYHSAGMQQMINHSSASTPSDEIKRAIAQLEQKIRKTKEAIKDEQMKCNENVNEYLKLSANAELSQSQRIKSVFEKNNQKSAQKISRYQKKLKRYDQEIKDIKERGIYYRHTRERLRDVGTNIKEGISGLSGGVIEGIKSGIHTAGETVITKPKEFFKRNTADSSIEKGNNDQTESNLLGGLGADTHELHHTSSGNSGLLNSHSHTHSHSTKCTSDEESSSITSGSGHLGTRSHNNSLHQSNSPLRIKPLKNKMITPFSESITPTTCQPALELYSSGEIEQLNMRIDERNQECDRLNAELTMLKSQFQSDCTILNQSLLDERYRVERIEEQLNDLTELHQKEIENLKQTITDLEEKIQYQTEERHRDVHEMLESFQTRISRMEHQQHQHLQQLVNLDSLENSNARALVLKLINVLLTVLQVILLLVATIANILVPFLHTRMRIFTSAIVIILFTFVFQHWPELSIWTRQKLYEKCFYILTLIPFLSNETS